MKAKLILMSALMLSGVFDNKKSIWKSNRFLDEGNFEGGIAQHDKNKRKKGKTKRGK